jgi:hypothetical protein
MNDQQQAYTDTLRNSALLVNPVNEKFTCGICLEVLEGAVISSEGHNFCMICLESALAKKETKTLPSSKQDEQLQHLTKACGERVVSCEHCHEGIKIRLQEAHRITRDMSLMFLPNRNLSDWVDQTSTHALNGICQHGSECPEEEIHCPYFSIGCTERRRRKDMAAHQKDISAHFSIFMTAMVEQQAMHAQLKRKESIISYASLFNSCYCRKLDA